MNGGRHWAPIPHDDDPSAGGGWDDADPATHAELVAALERVRAERRRVGRQLAWRVPLIVLVFGAFVVAKAEAAPKPVPASSVRVFSKRTTVAQPAPLTLPQLAEMAGLVVGRSDLTISCDQADTPGTDGETMDFDADGEVFYAADGTLSPVIHMKADICWDAQTANRHRDPNPAAYFTYGGSRYDNSGPAFLVLLHEALHVALQQADEGIVECSAVTNAWPLVRQLGLPAWESKIMLVGMRWRHHLWGSTSVYRSVC